MQVGWRRRRIQLSEFEDDPSRCLSGPFVKESNSSGSPNSQFGIPLFPAQSVIGAPPARSVRNGNGRGGEGMQFLFPPYVYIHFNRVARYNCRIDSYWLPLLRS